MFLFFLSLCAEVEGDDYGEDGHEQLCGDDPYDAQVTKYQAQQDCDDGFYGEQFGESFFHNNNPFLY